MGRAMRKSGLDRKEIFLETKLWPAFYEQPDAVEKTLERLDTDCIDLLLIHQPAGNYVAGYRQMEAAVRAGKVRAIGLSNFNKEQIREILSICKIRSVLLQTEVHPYFQETRLKEFLASEGMAIQAWYPLGHGDQALLDDTDCLFQTHFWGPIALIKAVLPNMRARRSGAIINFSSIAGLRTSPGSGYYAAAKRAVEGMSEGLRAELAPLGIKVMVVQPGAFRTEFAGRSLTQSKLVIADYENTAGARRIGKDLSHDTQPGDPDKGARLVVQAIEALEPPFRLLLSSDAVKFAETVIKDRREEYEKWAYLSSQSDFEGKGSGLCNFNTMTPSNFLSAPTHWSGFLRFSGERRCCWSTAAAPSRETTFMTGS